MNWLTGGNAPMDWTPEKEQRYQQLAGMLGGASATPVAPPMSFGSRLGQGFANVPSNVLSGLMAGATGLRNMADPTEQVQPWSVPKPYDLPPAQNWSDSLADVIPGMTAAVGTAMIPGGAVARGAQFLGAGSGTAAILGDIAGGAVLGASQSPGEAAGTGTEFGLLGAANRFLPNPWAKAAANAGIPLLGQLLRGHDPTSRDSLISMGANVLAPALLGQYARKGEASGDLLRPPTGSPDPSFQMGAGSDPRYYREGSHDSRAIVPSEQSPVYVGPGQGFTMPEGGTQFIEPRPVVPQPRTSPLALPEPRRLLERGDTIQTGYTDPEIAAWDGIEPSPERQAQLLGDPPQGFRQPERQQLLLRGQEYSPEARAILEGRESPGDLADEARRNAPVDPDAFGGANYPLRGRGGFIDPSNPLVQYGAGAIAGGVLNPLLDDDPDKSLLRKAGEGAAWGVGLTAAGRTLPRLTRFDTKGRLGLFGGPSAYGFGEAKAKGQTFSGLEGKPRFEIDDSQSLLRMGPLSKAARRAVETSKPAYAGKLHEVMGHDALFEQYPAFREAPVFMNGEIGDGGLYHPVSDKFPEGWIELGTTFKTPGEVRSVLLHEIQHRIQEKEGFAFGAPVDYAQKLAKPQLDKVVAEIDEVNDALARKVNESNLRAEDYHIPMAELWKRVAPELVARRKELIDHLRESPYESYRRVAGEYEARDVEARSNLSPEERAKIAPYSSERRPDRGLLFTYANGESAPSLGSELLRKKAAAQERDPEPFYKAPVKYAARFLETQLNLGKPDNVTFAQERGKGDANTLRQQQEAPRVGLLRAQTEDPAGYKAAQQFLLTKREPADVSILRANATPETAKSAIDYSNTKVAGQKVLSDATGNPMYTSTPEYQGGFYEAFANPKEWRKKLASDPSMKGNLTNALIRDNAIPGAERWEVEQAVDGFAKGTIAGHEFEGHSNAAKISKHLTEHKKDLTPEYRRFLGEYTDPVQREILTVHKLIASVAQARTISVLDEMGGLGKMPGGEDKLPIFDRETRRAEYAKAEAAGDNARKEVLADLVQVPENPAFGKLSGKFVPRSVSDALNAQNEVAQGGWMRGMSGATSWMKQALTLYNPGTHGRQILQIPMAALIARVHPGDFKRAWREYSTNADIREEILRNHISGADISSQDLKRGALEMDSTFNPDAIDRAFSKIRDFHRMVQKIYGLPDNIVRISAYIKNRPRFFAEGNAKGLAGDELRAYTERETTKWVNNHTMNYGIVPNIVKIGRETPFVSPFVSYQQQMLKLLTVLGQEAISGNGSDRAWALGNLGFLLGAPLMAAAYAKGQLSPSDQKEWDRAQRLSPAYSGGQIRVPLGRNKDGSFRYMNIGNTVPAGDTAAMLRNLANGDGAKFFSSNPFIGWEKSPILNLAAEQIKGRENVTDRKLDGPLDRARAAAKQALPPLTPGIGYEWDRLQSGFTPNADGGLGLTNARTGRVDTPGSSLLRQVGIPLSTVQPKQLLQRAVSDFNEEKASAGMELRQVTATNATPAARQKAQDKYIATVREKQRQLLERVR